MVAKETYVQKAGRSCQAPCLAPPCLPLQDVQSGHTPFLRLPTAQWKWECAGMCTHTCMMANWGWEHPLSAGLPCLVVIFSWAWPRSHA